MSGGSVDLQQIGRELVVSDVFDELRSAESKFPGFPVDALHAMAVLQEEVGELQKAILQRVYDGPEKSTEQDVRAEAVQVAAMALRFLFSMPQLRYVPCEQK